MGPRTARDRLGLCHRLRNRLSGHDDRDRTDHLDEWTHHREPGGLPEHERSLHATALARNLLLLDTLGRRKHYFGPKYQCDSDSLGNDSGNIHADRDVEQYSARLRRDIYQSYSTIRILAGSLSSRAALAQPSHQTSFARAYRPGRRPVLRSSG